MKKYTQKQQNQEVNSQPLFSEHIKSFNLSNTNNSARERDFTRICLLNQENLIFNSRVYQDYIKTYQKFISFYFIKPGKPGKSREKAKLIIYDTQSKKEETKAIGKYKTKIDIGACITQLPNEDLFCFGSLLAYRNAFIIDRNFHFHELPPGYDFLMIITFNNNFEKVNFLINFQKFNIKLTTVKCCWNLSAIYYNRSVYCFGGADTHELNRNNLIFSKRFDLYQNRWTRLSPIPEPAELCNSVIFNGNILISNPQNIHLLLYSVGMDSFSIIPYRFNMLRRIMTNAVDRLYLIESNEHWLIYESDVRDEFSWKLVSDLKNIGITHGLAYSCTYNKQSTHTPSVIL